MTFIYTCILVLVVAALILATAIQRIIVVDGSLSESPFAAPPQSGFESHGGGSGFHPGSNPARFEAAQGTWALGNSEKK